MQIELNQPGALLTLDGCLAQIGWSRQPLLDCNLEAGRCYSVRPFQCLRIKRWDYYAVVTPPSFFSATIADLGYAENLFVYMMNLETGELHEDGLVIPFGNGVQLPRNSTEGTSHFKNEGQPGFPCIRNPTKDLGFLAGFQRRSRSKSRD
ncbi:MAG: DUF2804 family protein [Anaerolineales bacterium]|jgi:hypothetical protein